MGTEGGAKKLRRKLAKIRKSGSPRPHAPRPRPSFPLFPLFFPFSMFRESSIGQKEDAKKLGGKLTKIKKASLPFFIFLVLLVFFPFSFCVKVQWDGGRRKVRRN